MSNWTNVELGLVNLALLQLAQGLTEYQILPIQQLQSFIIHMERLYRFCGYITTNKQAIESLPMHYLL